MFAVLKRWRRTKYIKLALKTGTSDPRSITRAAELFEQWIEQR